MQVIAYKGDPDVREGIWHRQMRGGRGGQAGPGTHVVLTTYDFLMSKTDRSDGKKHRRPQAFAACPR